MADGLIVGSAIVRRMAEAATKPRDQVLDEIGSYAAELLAAMQGEGNRHHLCEAPSGPFRQMVPVTFLPAPFSPAAPIEIAVVYLFISGGRSRFWRS